MQKKVLVYGKHQSLMDVALKVLENEKFKAQGQLELRQIKDDLKNFQPDILVIGGGVSQYEKADVTELLAKEYPGIKVYNHFGGPDGLVEGIMLAMEKGN